MANVYFLVLSRFLDLRDGTLRFNVLDVEAIDRSKIFTVDWNDPTMVSQKFTEGMPVRLAAEGGSFHLALSARYCRDFGIPTQGHGKRPDYLDRDAPPGGWFALDEISPKSLVMKTHEGVDIDLLDDALVLPGSLRSHDTGTLSLAITEALRTRLGLGDLPRYSEDPIEPSPTTQPPPSRSPPDRERMRALFIALANMLE